MPQLQLTKNFNLSEFHSHDGVPVPVHLIPNIRKLARNLQVLRDDIGVPIRIRSGYRSPKHNKAVGGVPGSQHPKGNAGDLEQNVFKPKGLYNRIEQLIAAGKMEQGGVGLYPTFVHYDTRGKKARW